MIHKKILLPVLVGTAFFFGACGDDDSAPISPIPTPAPESSAAVAPPPASSAAVVPPASSAVVPPPASSAVAPVPESSAAVPPPASSAVEPPPASSASAPNPVNYAPLATSANAATAASVYTLWKGYHFVTKETETTYYASIAKDYNIVFPATYDGAAGGVGRVVWSAQSSYYKSYCSVDDATVSTMKFRACTVSEGIGYGMLLAYFNNDVDTFNRLWNYTRGFRAYHNVKLMPWITMSFHWSEVDNSSATDADLDIATSLILMHYKMKAAGNVEAANNYLADALTFVGAIWEKEVSPSTSLIYSGDDDSWKKATSAYNLSYFSPVAIRLFALVDPAHNWQGVLDANYAYMKKVQDAGTGVFPDWSDVNGKAIDPNNGSAKSTYWTFNKESVRIPWRIAWDYYWYQDPRAAAILTKLNEFISKKASGDPNSTALSTNYSWDLSVGKDYANSSVSNQWYSAWCATGIAGNSTWLNKCTTGLNAKKLSNGPTSYFSDILTTMYSGLLNGLFVRPF